MLKVVVKPLKLPIGLTELHLILIIQQNMSQPQNFLPNGPSGDGESKNPYESVKTPERTSDLQQPPNTFQQVDGNVRPQLYRVDSRASLGPRPGFPNPLLRPQPPRPPPPGGTPFLQRPLIQRPPPPGQNVFPPRTPIAPNGVPQLRPQINPGYRPPPPNFQRPQTPIQRPQIFQQRSVPSPATVKPVLTNNLTKSQTLDSSEVQNGTTIESVENKNENEKPTITAMKETKSIINEDRRKSVTSIGSIEEEKRSVESPARSEQTSRPESRTENYMKKINEDQLYSHVNNSSEDLSEKSKSPNILSPQQNNSKAPSPQPYAHSPVTLLSKPPIHPQPSTPSPTPQNPTVSLPTPSLQTTERSKSPSMHKDDENSNRKTPEPKPKVQASPKLRLFKKEGDNDSGVDESTQGNDHVGSEYQSSIKKSSKSSTPRSATTPTKNKSFTRATKSPNPKSPETPTSAEKKKVPMNKVQVGSAPSPNLKVVKSKIGSLDNAAHKPGGGHVKIENRKIDFSTASSRVTAKNETYLPGGGEKKIQQQKLSWNASSKVGSLENATHKPKGGDKKIENIKLDFKEKAKPKIGSKDNMKHVPGGGDVKIESKKLDIKVQSKIGSLDNIKHKPGGGDKKIYDDKDYLRQMSAHSNASLDGSQNSSQADVREPVSDENLNRQH